MSHDHSRLLWLSPKSDLELKFNRILYALRTTISTSLHEDIATVTTTFSNNDMCNTMVRTSDVSHHLALKLHLR